jgi:hypothetical protein
MRETKSRRWSRGHMSALYNSEYKPTPRARFIRGEVSRLEELASGRGGACDSLCKQQCAETAKLLRAGEDGAIRHAVNAALSRWGAASSLYQGWGQEYPDLLALWRDYMRHERHHIPTMTDEKLLWALRCCFYGDRRVTALREARRRGLFVAA